MRGVHPARVAEMPEIGRRPAGADQAVPVVLDLAQEQGAIVRHPVPVGVELDVRNAGIERRDFLRCEQGEQPLPAKLSPVGTDRRRQAFEALMFLIRGPPLVRRGPSQEGRRRTRRSRCREIEAIQIPGMVNPPPSQPLALPEQIIAGNVEDGTLVEDVVGRSVNRRGDAGPGEDRVGPRQEVEETIVHRESDGPGGERAGVEPFQCLAEGKNRIPPIPEPTKPAFEMLSGRIEVRVPEMLVGDGEAVKAEDQETTAPPGAPPGEPEGAARIEHP